MRLLVCLTIHIFFVTTVYPQTYTSTQVTEIAKQLNEVKILSKKGSKQLVEFIEENKLTLASKGVDNTLLLYFLGQMFYGDFQYRTGVYEQGRFFQKHSLPSPIDQMSQDTTQLSPEAYEKKYKALHLEYTKKQQELYFRFEEELKNFKGYKIEEKIKNEENTLQYESSNSTFYLNKIITAPTEVELIHEQRSVTGKTNTRTLRDLLTIGLINKKIYDDVLPQIQEHQFFLEYLVLQKCAERAQYYNQYQTLKTEQLELLHNLIQTKQLSKEASYKIVNSYKDWELKEKFEFLGSCRNAKIFNLNDYPNDPVKVYPLLFESIKDIIPNFAYKNLSVKLLESKSEYTDDMMEIRIELSIEANGNIYTTNHFYDFRKIEPDSSSLADTLLQTHSNINTIVNKVLVDLNAPQRLYRASPRAPYTYESRALGLILLTEEQQKAWGPLDLQFLSQENHDNTFNSKNILKIVEEFKQIGLFNHLSKEEIKQAKETLKRASIESYQDVLFCFPKNIVYFDWETGNFDNPYEELTLEFGAASRGLFTPTDIVDEFAKSWDKPTTLFSFKFHGKTYSTQLEAYSDWLNPDFLELINKALKEHNMDAKIYTCLSDGQVGGYMILTKQQYKIIHKKYPNFFDDVY